LRALPIRIPLTWIGLCVIDLSDFKSMAGRRYISVLLKRSSGKRCRNASNWFDPSTGKIEKTYDAFLPPSKTSLVPVVVDPSGHWSAASNGGGEIVVLAVDQNAGTLSEPAHHIIFGIDADSVAFDHRGRFLYAAQTKNNVAAFEFDSKTGTIKLPALGKQGTGPRLRLWLSRNLRMNTRLAANSLRPFL
jgi:hypothetical protein